MKFHFLFSGSLSSLNQGCFFSVELLKRTKIIFTLLVAKFHNSRSNFGDTHESRSPMKRKQKLYYHKSRISSYKNPNLYPKFIPFLQISHIHISFSIYFIFDIFAPRIDIALSHIPSLITTQVTIKICNIPKQISHLIFHLSQKLICD